MKLHGKNVTKLFTAVQKPYSAPKPKKFKYRNTINNIKAVIVFSCMVLSLILLVTKWGVS